MAAGSLGLASCCCVWPLVCLLVVQYKGAQIGLFKRIHVVLLPACRAVARHGEKNWSTVARTFNQLMGRPPLLGRAPKQCRSRYLQQLVPGIKTGEWSVEEEEILVEGHKQFGNQWTLIASMLPGRTETSVKNHYNCTARRCGRQSSCVPPFCMC